MASRGVSLGAVARTLVTPGAAYRSVVAKAATASLHTPARTLPGTCSEHTTRALPATVLCASPTAAWRWLASAAGHGGDGSSGGSGGEHTGEGGFGDSSGGAAAGADGVTALGGGGESPSADNSEPYSAGVGSDPHNAVSASSGSVESALASACAAPDVGISAAVSSSSSSSPSPSSSSSPPSASPSASATLPFAAPWDNLPLSATSALRRQNVLAPMTIQAAAFGPLASVTSCLIGAVTGAGKTLGFVLPLLQRVTAAQWLPYFALILCPTRELALQTYLQTRSLVEGTPNLKGGRAVHLLSLGMEHESRQFRRLKREQPSIIIATPQRALEALERCAIADEIQTVILDEADRLLDPPGANPKKRRLRARHPKPAQLVLDRIIYQRTFEAEEDRGPFAAQRRKDVQVVAVSASLGADVRKELFERGWAPRPTRIMHLPAGRGSMPTTLKHFVASPCYSQVFLEPGTGRDRAMAAAEAAGGDVDPALLKRQASALLQQVHDVLWMSRAATAVVFVPTGVPLHDVRDMLLGRREAAAVSAESSAASADSSAASADSSAANTTIATAPATTAMTTTATPAALTVHVLYDHVHRRATSDAADERGALLASLATATSKKPVVVLVAMDASRGLDLPNIELAVLVGTPRTATDYVHLAGRVGRAGAQGRVVTVAYDLQQTERIARFSRVLKFAAEPFSAAEALVEWAGRKQQ